MIKWIYPTLIDNDEVTTTKKDVSEDMKEYVDLLINSILNNEATNIDQTIGDCRFLYC